MSESGLRVIKRVTGKRVELAGRTDLPAPFAAPLPAEPMTVNVTLLANGCDGYVMQYAATDAAWAGSTCHASLVAAEQHANALFGLRRSDWHSPAEQNENTTPRQTPPARTGGSRNPRGL